MRSTLLSSLACCLISVVAIAQEPADSSAATPVAEGFHDLFNGRDLTGWQGKPGWWKVIDGVLTCESTVEKPCPKSHYLTWGGDEHVGPQLGDFELQVVYRLTGPGNSGIQFRSERRPNFDTWGYQADLDAAGKYTGCIYHHARFLVAKRGQRATYPPTGEKQIETFGDFDKLLEAVKPNDWNEYRILARGPQIKLWINNTLMCEVEDRDPQLSSLRGIMALQMHQGPPMKIEFKSVMLRTLDE